MDGAPVEWWEWLGLLGPIVAPVIVGAATLTAASVAAWVAIKTLKQRDMADRRAEWWRRAQWALDAVVSDSPGRQELGLSVMDVLADSRLPSDEEVQIVARAWTSPLSVAEGDLDEDVVVGNNGTHTEEAHDGDDHSGSTTPQGRL